MRRFDGVYRTDMCLLLLIIPESYEGVMSVRRGRHFPRSLHIIWNSKGNGRAMRALCDKLGDARFFTSRPPAEVNVYRKMKTENNRA
jgi:hypothetical protein